MHRFETTFNPLLANLATYLSTVTRRHNKKLTRTHVPASCLGKIGVIHLAALLSYYDINQ